MAKPQFQIRPREGYGPVDFGMSPSELKRLLGSERTYEEWMGGNLNDSLLYPGIIVQFDRCDASGPLEESGVDGLRLAVGSGAMLAGAPVFGQPVDEVLARLGPVEVERPSPYSWSVSQLGIGLDVDDEGLVDHVDLWQPADQ